ncbi:MAG TPA: nucleotidyl transferase AbiEii/AbiGii toxin family protein [Chthoniobacteraceae bacterium]|nr:nucleotidyl transferase AbiEii/AbiGii toxin family protein [Chthoniobacteraceae bacterium]
MPGEPPAEAPFEAFANCGERLLLIGGNALLAFGSDRMTLDCDCAVIAADEQLVAGALAPLGYWFKERFSTFARYTHLGGRRPVVDVMLLDPATFEKLRSESEEIVLSGVKLRAPKPLHIVALKLHALKQQPERVVKDWPDICFLLRASQWTREELNVIAERYGSSESLEMLRKAGFL